MNDFFTLMIICASMESVSIMAQHEKINKTLALFVTELSNVEKQLNYVKKQVKYTRYLLTNIDPGMYKGSVQSSCGCPCGTIDEPMSGSGLPGLPGQPGQKNKKDPAGLAGSQSRGVTRGTTKVRWTKEPTGPKKKEMMRPRRNYFSTAYTRLLTYLGQLLKRSRKDYEEFTWFSYSILNEFVYWNRLSWVGEPMLSYIRQTILEINVYHQRTDSELLHPTKSRLITLQNRKIFWTKEENDLLKEADEIIEKNDKDGEYLFIKVEEVRSFPTLKMVLGFIPIPAKGYDTLKPIMEAFILPFQRLRGTDTLANLMEHVNDLMTRNGYKRMVLDDDSLRRQTIIVSTTPRFPSVKDITELKAADEAILEIQNRIKYSRMLIGDIEVSGLKERGCVCALCPEQELKPQGGGALYFTTLGVVYRPLPNYYDIVNNGFLAVGHEMFMDAIASQDQEYVTEVVKHTEPIIRAKLWKGQLRWLKGPIRQVIITTAKTMTRLPIHMLQERAQLVAFNLNGRYEMYSEMTNNIIDYAETLITPTNGRRLLRAMQDFEKLPEIFKTTPADTLCNEIVEAYELLFLETVGSKEFETLMYWTNLALVERYPELNNTKKVNGR